MKKKDLNTQELHALMRLQGVEVRPSYHHDDYMFTSFTVPYPLKNKLDRIKKKTGLSRSKILQMLINKVDEDNLLELFDLG